MICPDCRPCKAAWEVGSGNIIVRLTEEERSRLNDAALVGQTSQQKLCRNAIMDHVELILRGARLHSIKQAAHESIGGDWDGQDVEGGGGPVDG